MRWKSNQDTTPTYFSNRIWKIYFFKYISFFFKTAIEDTDEENEKDSTIGSPEKKM